MRLPKSFYLQSTITVARELLGKVLINTLPSGQKVSGRIVETEAYLGISDSACHSFNDRRTQRTEVMFKAGGYSYVYFIYGMHYCFNVVTQKVGKPEAVLIRALEPIEGVEWMQKARNVKAVQQLTNGPGKLCQALGISGEHNGILLKEGPIYIEDQGYKINKKNIITDARIGINPANNAAQWPLRFYISNNLYVSKSKHS